MSNSADQKWSDAQAGPYKVNSLTISSDADPVAGVARWDAGRTVWNIGMLAAAVFFGPMYFTWDAFLVFDRLN